MFTREARLPESRNSSCAATRALAASAAIRRSTDRIVVSLANPSGMIYTKQPVRVAGTFRLSPPQTVGKVGLAFYHLDNAELR